MAKIFSKTRIILLVILIIASFLRLHKLSSVPVSLFGDELDVGYHAYSILKTGRDYSGNFLPLHFQSLAEWRTPLYLYSAVPTVAIFGISPLGVRLPAAIFGILGVLAMYLLVKEVLSYGQPVVTKHPWALLAAFLMAINPWHIQYSRGGFEVTLLLLLLILGLWLFFKALQNGKYLWLAAVSLTLTPWVYSTAKLFTPLLLLFLFFIWRKEIFAFPKKYLLFAILFLILISAPIALSTLFGGGAQRFGYLSVFTDPVTENEVGVARLVDARIRGERGLAISPKFLDRVFHNKFTFWADSIFKNYLKAFSTDFLFIKGDPNLRHSIGIGEFYKVEFIALILGMVFFFTAKGREPKTKFLIAFWILAGVIPAAITRDGGNHATRLILILPPLMFLVSYGWVELFRNVPGRFKYLFFGFLFLLYAISYSLYAHHYWVHYPEESERWWHAGYKESFDYIKEVESNYQRIFISMKGEPAWIFFAGWYEYDPVKWHRGFPMKTIYLDGFGGLSYIDKYFFGSPDEEGVSIYDLPKFITNKDLYLAVAKEIPQNLIMDPGRVPQGLKLLKAVSYPSGEPAYYVFTKS